MFSPPLMIMLPHPTVDAQPPLGVDFPGVAGRQPAVRANGRRPVPVGPQQHRTAQAHFGAVGIDRHLDTREGNPSYTTPLPVSVSP